MKIEFSQITDFNRIAIIEIKQINARTEIKSIESKKKVKLQNLIELFFCWTRGCWKRENERRNRIKT